MTAITYILRDGSRRAIDVKDGLSAMQAAISNNISGIDGDCGGCLSCATCHVYVEEGLSTLPPLGEEEDALLEGVAAERKDTSRLACQIMAGPDHQGLVLRIPDRQG
jgi:2Fe-2S ferredoxin